MKLMLLYRLFVVGLFHFYEHFVLPGAADIEGSFC